ncbi:MAG: ABC-F family ATP-binding cassette domain-containing protein, partial [Chlamydiae bacterium]|nr:ABC-F family ATP-binding cassette domain-containing protein [Chlamydiota bacterium]
MFSVINLSVRFGPAYLFKKASFTLGLGVRYGLVGANGCGKSTLLKVLASQITPETGEIVKPKLATVGVLRQDYYLLEKETLVNVVLQGRQTLWTALKRQEELLAEPHLKEEHILELGEIEEVLQQEGGYSAENEAKALLGGLGIETAKQDQPLETLSGGYKIRVLLAQLLFAKPTLLLLDEPTNYLDIVSIRWLERYLQSFTGTVVLCSHDRSFLNNICQEILDIDYGVIKLYQGNYDDFVEQKAQDMLLRSAALENIEKKQKHLQDFAERFGAKASKARQAQSKLKAAAKLEEEKGDYELQMSSRKYPHFDFKISNSSGVIPLEVKNFGKSFHEHRLFHHLGFEIHRKDRLAIVGPNGVGKSTLLQILVGEKKQDTGEMKWGAGVRIGYFPQLFEKELVGFSTLLEYLSARHPEIAQQRLRAVLGQMLFKGDDVYKNIEQL